MNTISNVGPYDHWVPGILFTITQPELQSSCTKLITQILQNRCECSLYQEELQLNKTVLHDTVKDTQTVKRKGSGEEVLSIKYSKSEGKTSVLQNLEMENK